MKKLPNALSDEELLNILNEESDTEEVSLETELSADNSILSFFSKYAIYPGNECIRLNLLYRFYKYNTIHPLNRAIFYQFAQDYLQFDHQGKRNEIYVYINRPALEFLVKLKTIYKFKRQEKRVKRVYLPNLEEFFKEKKIKEGTVKIDGSTLYFFYDEWSYNNRKAHMPYRIFTNLCKLHFTTVRTQQSDVVFKLSQYFIRSIPKERLETAIKWGKKFRAIKKT